MKNINLLVFIFAIIVLVSSTSLVNAVAPVTDVSINLNDGLNIDFPKFEVIEQGKNFTFHFHVFNITNGIRFDNSTVNCSFELYNAGGEEQLEIDDLEYESGDWIIIVTGNNFTEVGSYAYLVECHTDSLGGFISFPFEVTTNGNPVPDGITIIFFSLLFIVIIVGMLSVLLYTIFQFIALSFNAKDLIVNVSIYLGLFATYILGIEYLGNAFVNDFLLFLLEAGAVTTVFLPIMAFTVSFIKERMENVKGDQE